MPRKPALTETKEMFSSCYLRRDIRAYIIETAASMGISRSELIERLVYHMVQLYEKDRYPDMLDPALTNSDAARARARSWSRRPDPSTEVPENEPEVESGQKLAEILNQLPTIDDPENDLEDNDDLEEK